MNSTKFFVLAVLMFGISANSHAVFPDDLDDVVFIEEGNAPGTGAFVRSMAVTARLIAEVSGAHPFGGANVILNSDKRNVWPAGRGSFQLSCCNANAWAFIKVGETWHAGTWEFLRVGQTTKSSRALVGPLHLRFGALSRYQPRNGDIVGFMVSGFTRNGLFRNNIRERSNISFYQIGVGPVSDDVIRGEPPVADTALPLAPIMDVLMDDDAQ